ncbi:alpha carbonic anhydrase of nostoc-like protein, partial [Thalassiosira pseudonana CCMP1335]
SEHRLCGKQYDAEMQLFHLHNEGNLEALAILIDADDGTSENPHFQKLLDFFQKKFNADKSMSRDWVWDPLEPGYILRSIHFWAYSGSTTEPPCFEGVNWRIIDVPMKISPGQYQQLQRLMFDHSNARPVQP